MREDDASDAANRPKITVRDLTVRFGNVLVLDRVSLAVADGEFVCLIGPSGCGKTTLLNAVAGFIAPSAGEVVADGNPVRGPGRERGMVFQEYALFPWFTVAENVGYGPKLRGVRGERLAAITERYLSLVQLPHAADRYPRQLSGGMRQRVALARALASNPDVLLMDEPFGALDALTRETMQDELLRIWEVERRTCLFVTHSLGEAIFLADRIVVLASHPGRIAGTFEIALPRPRNRTAPDFFELLRSLSDTLRAEIAAAKAAETTARLQA